MSNIAVPLAREIRQPRGNGLGNELKRDLEIAGINEFNVIEARFKAIVVKYLKKLTEENENMKQEIQELKRCKVKSKK
jgi:hypothetical protein